MMTRLLDAMRWLRDELGLGPTLCTCGHNVKRHGDAGAQEYICLVEGCGCGWWDRAWPEK